MGKDQALRDKLLQFVGKHSRGVSEDKIWKYIDALPDEVEGNYADVLFELVLEGELSWRLPAKAKDELTTPLVYQRC